MAKANMGDIFRRDDLFHNRHSIRILKSDFIAAAVRRGDIDAIPHFWSILWDYIPILERSVATDHLAKEVTKKLNKYRSFIDTNQNLIYHDNYIGTELDKLYLTIRNSLFYLELDEKQKSHPIVSYVIGWEDSVGHPWPPENLTEALEFLSIALPDIIKLDKVYKCKELLS